MTERSAAQDPRVCRVLDTLQRMAEDLGIDDRGVELGIDPALPVVSGDRQRLFERARVAEEW